MIQLLLHLLGDYILQNDWMAVNKKKRTWTGELACQIHCVLYSLPFLFWYSWEAVSLIYVSHYIVDRTNIVAWFISVKNGVFHTENFGFPKERPFVMTVWLCIIIDNIFHIFCNYGAIYFFN